MKTIKVILILLTAFTSSVVIGQDKSKKSTEINFNVDGVCDMCKARIEKALDTKGVKFSEWNEETHNCTVVFKPSIITEKEIHKLIANAGHDTDSTEASDTTYNDLHHCCKYRK